MIRPIRANKFSCKEREANQGRARGNKGDNEVTAIEGSTP